jgi:signal transduction histidine kinase
VHDLKNLAGRLAILCHNLDAHYNDPMFKVTALDVLDDTVLHLKKLAGDLRDHEGRVIIKLRVDLTQVLRDALADQRPDLAEAVELFDRLEPVPAIWGDALLLRLAFAGTIENALQAMDGHGRLSVRTRLTNRAGSPRAVVEIADDGPGMSEEFLKERLFSPIESAKADGLGLGVYSIRQVAALHGATVRVRSAEGAGTRVRFSFPADGD